MANGSPVPAQVNPDELETQLHNVLLEAMEIEPEVKDAVGDGSRRQALKDTRLTKTCTWVLQIATLLNWLNLGQEWEKTNGYKYKWWFTF